MLQSDIKEETKRRLICHVIQCLLVSCSNSEQSLSEEHEAYINSVTGESVLPVMTIDKVRDHYVNDDSLNEVALLLRDNVVPNKNKNLDVYRRIWYELSLVVGVVLRGDSCFTKNTINKGCQIES